MLQYADFVAETAADLTSATVVSLNSSPSTSTRNFAKAKTDGDLTDGNDVIVRLEQSGAQATWRATYDYISSTLTRVSELQATGTLAIGPSNTTVYITVDTATVQGLQNGLIIGVGYNRSTATAIQIETGRLTINAVPYEITAAFTTTTSDSSALASEKMYYVYLVNDSGTIKQHLEQRDTSGDDPIYNDTLKQWSHPNATGLSASTEEDDYRCIGYFGTNTSSQITPFNCCGGNLRDFSEVFMSSQTRQLVKSGAGSTTIVSIDASGVAPVMATGLYIIPGITPSGYVSAAGLGIGGSVVAGQTWDELDVIVNIYSDISPTKTYLGRVLLPVSGPAFYYANGVATDTIILIVTGSRFGV